MHEHWFLGKSALVTVSHRILPWLVAGRARAGRVRPSCPWPPKAHRIPTSPRSCGSHHKKPTAETELRGTPWHGCYHGCRYPLASGNAGEQAVDTFRGLGLRVRWNPSKAEAPRVDPTPDHH